ncbi:hypothetical protein [Lactiplantibacillus pingfangensis]|uniref:hypothetical protein n=1 Tax=Lactiplantibacillus TaxID=2767842 RepID=UPI0010F9CD70|nr:hypothetical protein [Lactiplantibacillus pingfangensis]
MASASDIVTDGFSTVLDENFRNQLVGNFKIIKALLGGIDGLADKVDTDTDAKVKDLQVELEANLDKQLKQLGARINRIVVGTDDESIRIVVTEILQEKGVI